MSEIEKKSDPKIKLKIVAVILAGGGGKRMGGSYKQFIKINNRPILFYSIDVFLQCAFISEIIIVVPKEKFISARKIIDRKYGNRPIHIAIGGKARRYSTHNALKYIRDEKKECDYVVIHDGVRPLLSVKMTRAVVEKAIKHGAAVLGSKVLNVIAKVENGKMIEVLNPQRIFNTQTPHCYRFDWILSAHESELNRGRKFDLLENIELISACGKEIFLVDKFYRNMKLTFRQDIIALEAYLKKCRSEAFFSLR